MSERKPLLYCHFDDRRNLKALITKRFLAPLEMTEGVSVQPLIIEYAKQYFGNDSKLYLFGSRVYDDKKGGDIDLLLESAHDIMLE